MATAVFFHAHPDDECILTGGTMAMLAAAGHRVVLLTATSGERGEVGDGVLAEGTTLGAHRATELTAAAAVLGVSRAELLGYVDSGMLGSPDNADPASFCQADVDEAAARVAQILRDEDAALLVTYDAHGGYGHPDHVQVHRVGVRAAELAGTPVVYEATIDRDRVSRLVAAAAEDAAGERLEPPDGEFGSPAELITTRIDVSAHVERKRHALSCHASQVADSFFLTMPEARFALAFGTEDYIRRGERPQVHEVDLDLSGRP